MITRVFTDFPFVIQLNDLKHQEAPIREVKVLSYDGDKYCTIEIEGQEADVKLGHLYFEEKRFGKTDSITPEQIVDLLAKQDQTKDAEQSSAEEKTQ
jgi:hypothetical protein